jgi:hypothetical protein
LAMPTVTVIHDPRAIPQPEVKSHCKRCRKTLWGATPWAGGVISPSGIEHIAEDYGMTACGIDAKGDNWWWR